MDTTFHTFTYDEAVDAAAIWFVDPNEQDRITTLPLESYSINLDFNEDGQLVGIESLNASGNLPPELLATAERL
jgi:uncharacterized protein YuzE